MSRYYHHPHFGLLVDKNFGLTRSQNVELANCSFTFNKTVGSTLRNGIMHNDFLCAPWWNLWEMTPSCYKISPLTSHIKVLSNYSSILSRKCSLQTQTQMWKPSALGCRFGFLCHDVLLLCTIHTTILPSWGIALWITSLLVGMRMWTGKRSMIHFCFHWSYSTLPRFFSYISGWLLVQM